MATSAASSKTPTVRLIGALVAIFLAAPVVIVMASAAEAAPTAPIQADQTTDSDRDPTLESGDSPGIIPKPNSGVEPASSGDRGGSLQSILFVGMLAAMLFVAYLAYRDSRRSLARIRSES